MNVGRRVDVCGFERWTRTRPVGTDASSSHSVSAATGRDSLVFEIPRRIVWKPASLVDTTPLCNRRARRIVDLDGGEGRLAAVSDDIPGRVQVVGRGAQVVDRRRRNLGERAHGGSTDAVSERVRDAALRDEVGSCRRVRLREFEPTLRVPVCCLGSLNTDQLAKRTLDAPVTADVGRLALERCRSRRRGVTDDGPGRKPTVSDEEILAVFENAADPVLKAGEVADQLSIGRRAVYDRLRALEEEGVLKSKKTGRGVLFGGIRGTHRRVIEKAYTPNSSFTFLSPNRRFASLSAICLISSIDSISSAVHASFISFIWCMYSVKFYLTLTPVDSILELFDLPTVFCILFLYSQRSLPVTCTAQ